MGTERKAWTETGEEQEQRGDVDKQDKQDKTNNTKNSNNSKDTKVPTAARKDDEVPGVRVETDLEGGESGMAVTAAHGDDQTAYAEAYFSERLVEWYVTQKRDLPWRRSRDPYRIWVSEIMLQQTRVETVIPYYHRFLDKFPTVEVLADAPEEEVLKAWEGLGYYSRARNLQAAVREVKAQYGGQVPSDRDSVFRLKGVGPYTAGAILSIAFNQPEPAVDGNVMRVLSRYFRLEDDIAKPKTRTSIEARARRLIPEGKAGDFNQALMELGATVCTPRSPHCLICPVMEHCTGRLAGMEEALPVKSKAKPPRPEERAAAWIAGTGAHAGKFLVRRRPDDGLLAKMWELPHVLLPTGLGGGHTDTPSAERSTERSVEKRRSGGSSIPSDAGGPRPKNGNKLDDTNIVHWMSSGREATPNGVDTNSDAHLDALGEWVSAAVREETGLEIEPVAMGTEAEHTFSHIHWRMQVIRCSAAGAAMDRLPDPYRWISVEEMEGYAFPNVFLRIIRQEAAV